jgi:cation transport regulator
MKYKELQDLPETVTKRLPMRGQKIYMQAFNDAWFAAVGNGGGGQDGSPEAAAHRMAWSAVLKEYEPSDNGKWQPKKD